MTIGRGGGCIQDSMGGRGDYARGNDPSFVPKWAQIFILHIISLFLTFQEVCFANNTLHVSNLL